MMAMAQQEPDSCWARCRTHAPPPFAPHQISDRLMGRGPGPTLTTVSPARCNLGQVDRIPPVVLIRSQGFREFQRRSDPRRTHARLAQLALDAITARSGFIAKPQLGAFPRQLSAQRLPTQPACSRTFPLLPLQSLHAARVLVITITRAFGVRRDAIVARSFRRDLEEKADLRAIRGACLLSGGTLPDGRL